MEKEKVNVLLRFVTNDCVRMLRFVTRTEAWVNLEEEEMLRPVTKKNTLAVV